IQGTAEGVPFSKEQLGALVDCAEKALKRVFEEQEKVLS
ncbi:MAG: ribonuclease PH, partial [Halobacteriovoraceae bacterium]|nr:ribonuclease PH [Halobacteriovoraceae bacterium]